MTSILVDVVRATLGWIFLVYTAVAASHFILQLWYSHRTYRRQASPEFAREFPDHPVAVDILVPVYNEDPALLEACVRSSLAQDHPGPVKVIVIDDGSPNRDRLEPVYASLERDGVTVIRAPRNMGKRHAQGLGLEHCEGEIIVTLDSDTILRPDAVRMLTRQFRDPRVGAATGFVDVENYRKNLLTRLQQLRWSKSFYRELIWTMPYIGQRPWYSRFDLVAQVAMPLMLTLTAPSALLLGLLLDPAYIVHFVVLIAVVAAIRSTYPAVRNRDPSFYLFVLYGFVSAFLMMSVRVMALSTLTDSRWGTRGTSRSRTGWPFFGAFARGQLALATAGASDEPGPGVHAAEDQGAAGRAEARASFDPDGADGAGRSASVDAAPRRRRERRASRPAKSAPRSNGARKGQAAPKPRGR